MSILRRSIVLACCCIALSLGASAQAPRTVSFQGVLADQNGTLIPDGNHALQLALYATASGGTAVYSEKQTVPVVKGVFNAIIGSVTAIPASLPFDRAYFLGVSVDNGAELAPRTALTAVPYAIHAETAGTADVAKALAPNATGVVTAINNQAGGITLQGAGGTTVSNNGGAFTISSTGGGGTGIGGVQSTDGSIAIALPNGPVADLTLALNGVTTPKLADGAVSLPKISTIGASAGQVLSYNGSFAAWSTPQSGGGGLTLPYSGQYTSNTEAAFSVANNGSMPGVQGTSTSGVGVIGASGGNAGVWGSNTAAGSAVMGSNTGTGRAGYFSIGNTGSSATALEVVTSGKGNAGYFEVSNTSNGNSALVALNSGAGDGLVGNSERRNGVIGFSKGASDNGVFGGNDAGGNGVMGRCVGAGNAVLGFNGGTGRAGYFSIGNTGSSATALEAVTAGTGRAAYFESSSANHGNTVEAVANGINAVGVSGYSSKGIGVKGESATNISVGVLGVNNGGGDAIFGKCESGNGKAVEGINYGTGIAAGFSVMNSSSNAAVVSASTNGNGDVFSATISSGNGNGVYAWTIGTGTAGYFEVASDLNTKNAIEGTTNGTGNALVLNHVGASGNIAVLKSGGVNKARIDKTGKGFFNGGTQASGADVAEAFDVEGNRAEYEPGDVLVLSREGGRKVARSGEAYSELVAGVIATKPGVLLTELDVDADLSAMVPMGVIGVIPTKVSSENGPIRVGDLLVTSSTPGCAMRADRSRVSIGTVLGKAMEAYNGEGVAKISVLVSIK